MLNMLNPLQELALGDAQLMIPIEMPLQEEEGDLWVKNRKRILPVTVGDVLLFAAHRPSPRNHRS